MITWLTLLPLSILPFIFTFLPGVIPVYGGIVRQWFVNTILPVFPLADQHAIVDWYQQTNTFGEILLHALIALNINAILLPLMYLFGSILIKFYAWWTITDMDSKRKLAKR